MRNLILLTALACTALLSCSLSPLGMGGSTSTPNEVVMGSVMFPNGTPAERTIVQLIPSSYAAIGNTPSSTLPTDTTDESGAYRFTRVDTGTYNIQAVHLDTRARALVTGIAADTDTVIVPSVVLELAGNLIVIPDSLDSMSGYLYIPGTTIARFFDGTQDTLVLDSVPPGTIPGVYYSTTSGSETTVLRYDVSVPSGDVVTIANPKWKFSRRLYLNTTTTAAAVSGNVTDFPVLIRLTGINFTFSQAQTRGEDLRFAKSDNTPLPYEIERWDPVTEHAEVWVKVDTVLGNNSSQYIQMFWGRDDVGSVSDPAAVFDTANGFAGVWHMNEYPSGAASIRDRTQNAYNGTPAGMNASASVEGVAGKCLDFNGSSDFITLPAIATDFTGGMTVCGWMKFRSFNNYSRLIDFGVDGDNNNNIVLCNKSQADSTTLLWTIWNDTTGETPLDVRNYFVRDEWIYVTGSYNGATMSAYKNGTQVGSIGNPGGLKSAVRAKCYIAKSNWTADKLFNGLIDELQVSKTARSADWIKLSYMNQKAQDALVQFR
ncbi:MAG: DUF2341 domain-containing protein [Chitinispirillaceae bacterium]|nr:DUF2341 domain-containing protein [Chitinispirillaceae bacterium]